MKKYIHFNTVEEEQEYIKKANLRKENFKRNFIIFLIVLPIAVIMCGEKAAELIKGLKDGSRWAVEISCMFIASFLLFAVLVKKYENESRITLYKISFSASILVLLIFELAVRFIQA